LSSAAHAAYLLLYVAMFLLDDVIVFVTAMITLRATGLTATYSRYSHLIGAVVLIGIGAALLMAPELLSLTSTRIVRLGQNQPPARRRDTLQERTSPGARILRF